MKWSLVKRKLGRVDRAIDKAIARAEIPGAVLLGRMHRDEEVLEHEVYEGHPRRRSRHVARVDFLQHFRAPFASLRIRHAEPPRGLPPWGRLDRR